MGTQPKFVLFDFDINYCVGPASIEPLNAPDQVNSIHKSKPKVQTCKFKNGFCDKTHIKIENKKGKTKPTSYFIKAIANSMRQRDTKEKLKKNEAVLQKKCKTKISTNI